ncbi:competence protein ComGF [Pelagirhabdus alkalitolerans]|uniref:Competence protein ComGF n=1 Tax=Pelagirhabdus alkalitolerans TaxID=1612202 RepID=A0A1G6HYK7_9BACI|nr:competence type IV pilus minor pilin ComGF [Pelagirhabdus alkalitolerans]SDB99379.1 competence protein ComGF [Pelagirhabdus alkalitolerans]
MLKEIKTSSRFIFTNKNQDGFTLVEALISIVVLSLITLLLPSLYTLVVPVREYDQHAVYQFFHFITDEISQSEIYSVSNDQMQLNNTLNETITIEQYQTVIRRRVNQSGHEILLRDVLSFELVENEHFIHIKVMTQSGEHYEKNIHKTIP